MKKSIHYIAVVLILLPFAYLFLIWKQLPDIVPTHWSIHEIDRFGSKRELLLLLSILSVTNGLVYLLLCNIYRIDPKKQAIENKGRLQKIALAVVIFISALEVWITYTTKKAEPFFSAKFIFIGIGLLFSIIGNYMYNLKPNWFAGLRLPWTLENEDNWRRTHHLASKLWFAGGLLMALFGFILPFTPAVFAIFIIGAGLIIVPCVYSYRLYKKLQS
ncbi:MAG: SdpI family protein [Chitinophagaceae bacterium]|nr:SdpI family protein [Chitinophagaceae bacterium]